MYDKQKNPKIADVGLSKLMTSTGNTNGIATVGTLGYRAPELSKVKNANTKANIFNLGMIILELLTGKSPSEATDVLDLPQWVASIVKEEGTNKVFDVELMRDASNIGDELLNTLKLALHCVDPTLGAGPECDRVLQKQEEINPELASHSDGSKVVAVELPAGAKDGIAMVGAVDHATGSNITTCITLVQDYTTAGGDKNAYTLQMLFS